MQKKPKQKRSEVLDEKLDELIDVVVFRVGNYAKGRQAIIDYHDKKVKDATKHIRVSYNIIKTKNFNGMPKDKMICMLDMLRQAIKKDLEGK